MDFHIFSLLLIGLLAGTGEAEPCGNIYSAPNGTVTVNATSAKKDTDCVYTIMRNSAATGNSLLQITSMNLVAGDKLVIYDGVKDDNNTIVKYTVDSRVDFQVVIGFQQNTTIVFTPSEDNTSSKWSISFNTAACSVDFTSSWTQTVKSPVYRLTPSKSINCTYTVNSALPLDQLAVMSFSTFELRDASTLTVTSGSISRQYKDGVPADDFFAPGSGAAIQMAINIANTSSLQAFTALVEPVAADCSGEMNFTGDLPVNYIVDSRSVPHVCRMQIHGSLSTIAAIIKSPSVLSNGDQLVFVDGGSSYGQVLASLSDSVADSDYLVTSSANTVIVSLTLGREPGQRSLNISFRDQEYGGRLSNSGVLSAKGNKPSSGVVYFQLLANTSQLVNVASITNLTSDTASLTFYNGLQTSDPVLTVFTANFHELSTVIGGSQMLVVLANLTADAQFNATFTSIQPGCDMLATLPTGELMFEADTPANTTQTCTWTIAPLAKDGTTGTIVVDLDTINLRGNETVMIYAGLEDSSKKLLAQFSGPTVGQSQLPQLYALLTDKVRVIITRKTSTSIIRTRVSLRYQVAQEVCGGVFTAAGTIMTPNFPNQYPLNAQCTWKTDNTVRSGQSFYLNFVDLALAQDHSITVAYVNGQNKSQQAEYKKVSLTPADLPADLIIPFTNGTQVAFQSTHDPSKPVVGDINQVAGGAKLNYQVLNCGGNVSAAKDWFMSPGYPQSPDTSVYCLWIVDVGGATKQNYTNIINFTIATTNETLDKYLTFYDGHSVRNKTFQVNMTQSVHTLSRYDRMIVVFNYTKPTTNAGEIAFNLTFTTKECGKSELCDNGICMHLAWRCNGINDCGDNSDEVNCDFAPTVKPETTTTPKPPPETDYSGWVKSGWVPGCLFIGIILGAVLLFVVPRIIRRIRGRGGSYSRMADDRPVVT